MFGWFAPRSPLDTQEKTWTEMRMAWLAERLGGDRLLRAPVLLPLANLFPPAGLHEHEKALHVMRRLCPSFGLNPDGLELQVVGDEQLPNAAGLYIPQRQRSIIMVARSQIEHPLSLTATLAHELAHELLLGGGLLDSSVSDQEQITDLVPVYLGAGLFGANATLHEECGMEGQTSWWTMRRQGYLPSRVFGYALALFAHARGEKAPTWAKHLRPDAAEPFQKGLVYLRKTADTLFGPENLHRPSPTLTQSELLAQTRDRSATKRLAALWLLCNQPPSSEMIDPVCARLDDDDSQVAAAAARLLGEFRDMAVQVNPALLRAVSVNSAPLQREAAGALARLGARGLDPNQVGSVLCGLLRDEESGLAYAGANALGQLRSAQIRISTHDANYLLQLLHRAIVDQDDGLARALAAALVAVTDNPRQAVKEHFWEAETRRACLELVRHVEKRAGDE